MATRSFPRRILTSRRLRSRKVPGLKPWDYWAVAVCGGMALLFFVLTVLGPGR